MFYPLSPPVLMISRYSLRVKPFKKEKKKKWLLAKMRFSMNFFSNKEAIWSIIKTNGVK